jgi:hypothetical protein
VVESGRRPAGFPGSMTAPSVHLDRRGLDRSPWNGAAFPIVEEVSSAESTDVEPKSTTLCGWPIPEVQIVNVKDFPEELHCKEFSHSGRDEADFAEI